MGKWFEPIKLYGVPAIVGRRALAPGFSALELDSVSVKGRTRATQIFALVDTLGVKENQRECLGQKYGAFLAAYRNQEWDAAERLIDECRNIGVAQLNNCYSLFAEHIKSLRETSLPSNWDGTFALTEK